MPFSFCLIFLILGEGMSWAFLTSFAVIGVDSNAKNQLWNSVYTDQKDTDFEQLALVSKLNVMNATIDSLKFVPGGTSFVDVTLAGDQVKLHCWRFLPFASLSDHPFIYFEIDASSPLNFARIFAGEWFLVDDTKIFVVTWWNISCNCFPLYASH